MGIDPVSLAAYASIGSAVLGGASSLGVLGGKPKGATLPKIETPAQAATTHRDDASQRIVVGSDTVANQRVSGGSTRGGTAARSTNTLDILGGLGAGGINI